MDSALITDEQAKANAYSQLKEWIDGPLTDNLLKIIDDLNSLSLETHSRSDKSISLSFVKAITYIMSLEKERVIKESVAAMKRLLLVQLQIQEFSIESEFKNPNPSYVLRDVICTYCSHCR